MQNQLQEILNEDFDLKTLLQKDYNKIYQNLINKSKDYYHILSNQNRIPKLPLQISEQLFHLFPKNKYQLQNFNFSEKLIFNKEQQYFLINYLNCLIVSEKNILKFYHFDTQQYNEYQYDNDYVTSIDYCIVKNKFVFGHKSGKISFAYYTNRNFQKQQKVITGKTNKKIKSIRFLFFDQIFIWIDDENKSEIIYFLNNNSIPQTYRLLKSQKNFTDINTILFQKNDIIYSCFISLSSVSEVYVISFEIQAQQEQIIKVFQLQIQKKFLQQILPQNKDNETEVIFKKIKEKTFLIIKWCHQIEILNIEMIEDDEKFQFNFIKNHEFNFEENLLQLFMDTQSHDIYVLQKSKYLKFNLNNFQDNIDTLQKNEIIINEFQIKQILMIRDFRKKSILIKGENKNLFFGKKPIQLYIQEIFNKGYLTGLEYLTYKLGKLKIREEQNINKNTHQQIKIQQKKFELFQLISDFLEQNLQNFINSEDIESLIPIVLNLLFDSQNEKIFLNFLNKLSSKNNISISEFYILLSSIKNNLNDNIIGESMNEIFFTYLCRFLQKGNQFKEPIQSFIFYIYLNFSINESLQGFILSLALAYNLDYFVFYCYIQDPFNLNFLEMTYQNQYNQQQQIFYDRLFEYIYDLWNEQQICSNMIKKEEIIQRQYIIKQWFVQNFQIFLKPLFKECLFILLFIHNQQEIIVNQKNLIFNLEDKYNQFCMDFLKQKQLEGILLLSCLVFSKKNCKFNDDHIMEIVTLIMNQQHFQLAQEILNFSYYYKWLFKYYVQNNDLINNKEFQLYVRKNQNQGMVFQIFNSLNLNHDFTYYLDKNQHYLILYAFLSKVPQEKKYVNIMRNYANQILQKTPDEFQELFSLLEIEDQLYITEQIKDKNIQKQLFAQILQNKKGLSNTLEDNVLFRLLCKHKPESIVDFLKSRPYNIQQIKNILEEFHHLRGKGYILFKSGQEMKALGLYQNYIIEMLEEKNYNEIISSVKDIIEMDKILLQYDYILIILLNFLNSLKIKDDVKKQLIKLSFYKLFDRNSYEVLSLLQRYQFYEQFVKNRLLVTYILGFYKKLGFVNKVKQDVFDGMDIKQKNIFLRLSLKGILLYKTYCQICNKLEPKEKEYDYLYYHNCKSMYHKECLLKLEDGGQCIYCERKNMYKYEQLEKKSYLKRKTTLRQELGIMRSNQITMKLKNLENFDKARLYFLVENERQFDELNLQKSQGIKKVKYCSNYFEF